MPQYEVILKPDAEDDLDRLRRFDAVAILDTIERHLATEPTREGKSRIKRLRGNPPADYRLRVGDYRVFYRVVGREVHVLRVMHKEETRLFYEEEQS